MKKALLMLITVAMVISASAMTASAKDITDASANKSDTVIVQTSKLKDTDGDGEGDTSGENFTVTIPADTTIPWLSTSEYNMGYTVSAQLEVTHRIKVEVAGNTTSQLKTADNAYALPYSLTGTKSYTSTTPVVTSAAVTLPLKVTDWSGVPVGEYKDTLTYTASIVNA